MTGLRLGVDRLDLLREVVGASARLGLVTNDVALTSDLVPARVALRDAGFDLVRLFSPEHGLSAQGRDGSYQGDAVDELTGLPVTSLYGDRLAPDAGSLAGLDAVVVDLPDVGCRFYTYAWTMSHVLEACDAAGVPVVVLDRPNPLGGLAETVEGPMLDASCASFVGRWPLPVRHGLTMGELARLWHLEGRFAAEPHVVPLEGWVRADHALTSDRPWVPPSPGMPSAHTAAVYPGLGLLEGVNVSDGRGTAVPFRALGAPWIDPLVLWREFSARELPGVAAIPYAFTPSAEKYAGELCRGLLLTVTDVDALRPVRMGVELLALVMRLWPEHVTEHRYTTRANPSGTHHLDLLLGVPDAADRVRAGTLPLDAPADWETKTAPVRLY